MTWRATALVALACLGSGCSKGDSKRDSSKAPPGATSNKPSELISTSSGVSYSVSRVAGFDTSRLPKNNDLKMADGDLARFAVGGCDLDVAAQYAPTRCDLYVQSDGAGTLIGYAFVSGDGKRVRIETATILNDERQPGGGSCYLGGTIYDNASSAPVSDSSRDFTGRQMYSTWENGSGSQLVSEVDPNAEVTDEAGATGVWYVTKQGNKLRISQERWNYCYARHDVYIDDVFYRAVGLEKVAR